MEAGVDSLAASELSSWLRLASEVVLSPTPLFKLPTPCIASHIREQMSGKVMPSAAAVSVGTPSVANREIDARTVRGRWPDGCSTSRAVDEMAHDCGGAIGLVPTKWWVLEKMVDIDSLSGFRSGAELSTKA